MLSLEAEAAQATLDQVEADFGCGRTDPDQVARFWLITAGLAVADRDQEAVEQALTAARYADPTTWLEALGGDLEASWKVAEPPEERGTVHIEDLTSGYEVRIDGRPTEGPTIEVPVGLHVVQVASDTHGWGRMIRVQGTARVTTDLPAFVAPEPTPEPDAPEAPARERRVGLHVGAGMRLQLGKRYDTVRLTESSTKIGPTLETGLWLDLAPVLVRAGLAVDVPINSRYVYLDGDGEARVLPLAPSLWGAVGVRIGDLGVGLHLAAMLPARLPLHLTGSYALTSKLGIEARIGGALVSEQERTGDAVATRSGFEGSVVLLATLAL